MNRDFYKRKKQLRRLAIMMSTLNLTMFAVAAWVIGSAVASGVKAATGQCGSTFGIEETGISGDWFCAK